MIGNTLALIVFCLGWTGMSVSASPTSLPSEIPSPLASVSSEPSMATLEGSPLTAKEQSTLLREFTRAQYSEMKGLKHRYALENKELKNSQKIRLKEWKSREQSARHKYWEYHDKGQEKRAYIQDYLERFNDFRKSLADEKKSRAEDQKAQILALKKEQAANYKEFRNHIDQKVRPPKSLWPSSGR